ncbi:MULTISPECIES: hypothetical protein [Olivibacter]|uniref:Uncharacterized protein n=1 Tax=Olivibacter jilunii TaxID=985016 RepID=A0ABW6BA16_9SPHI|nr:hypothetical protein [Olivibacter sp. UJ_SKK_5.1]MDX3912626.1 hypothetical protein [Pseudosphingobacterium sp.]
MISVIIFTVLLFAILWAWIAYEYQHAITISIEEEELYLNEQLKASSYGEGQRLDQ